MGGWIVCEPEAQEGRLLGGTPMPAQSTCPEHMPRYASVPEFLGSWGLSCALQVVIEVLTDLGAGNSVGGSLSTTQKR